MIYAIIIANIIQGAKIIITDKQPNDIHRAQETVMRSLNDARCPINKYRGEPLRISTQIPYARYFDHTLLKPDATDQMFDSLFDEATQLKTASVCIPPNRVQSAAYKLRESEVKVCSVVGFPFGYDTTQTKSREVEELRSLGCDEFDMVIPIGILLSGDIPALYRDIAAVVAAADGKLVKSILETAYLTQEQICVAAFTAIAAGASMLKTSTGYAARGASIEDIKLLRVIAGDTIGVKASGGIRTKEFARECIAAGADRLGASSTVSIIGDEI